MTVHEHDIEMRVTAVRQIAAQTNLYEFAPADGSTLPAFEPGAHVDIHLPNGLVRQYSLVNESGSGGYAVAVKLDRQSRGGSRCVHEELRVGTIVRVSAPRNNFKLHEDADESIFIAGGIGITPISAMVARLRRLGKPWRLYYAVRLREEAAFLDVVDGEELFLHVDQEQGGRPLDVASVVNQASAGAHLYCCGPAPMLDSFETHTALRPSGLVHIERFAATSQTPNHAGGYEVRLARSGKAFSVPVGQSLLEALRAHGVEVTTSCEQGVCGTCETAVISGVPDHRDSLLTADERALGKTMMVCCSGCSSPELVLDL